jgi:hypothetical protein
MTQELRPIFHAKGRGLPMDLLQSQSAKLMGQLSSLAKSSHEDKKK